jgi:hypothetical protein
MPEQDAEPPYPVPTCRAKGTILKLPAAFTAVPRALDVCNAPATAEEMQIASSVRRECVIPGWGEPYMEDVVRAFRLAKGAKVYIEVGTQDKGNIAWLARTQLAPGATIIDIDLVDYPANDVKIRDEMRERGFDYHAVR